MGWNGRGGGGSNRRALCASGALPLLDKDPCSDMGAAEETDEEEVDELSAGAKASPE